MNRFFFLCLFPLISTAQEFPFLKSYDRLSLTQLTNLQDEWTEVDSSLKEQSILSYASLSGKGQAFYLNHQQNFGKYLSLELNVDKFSQDGVFNKETLKFYDVDVGVFFENKQKNYFLSGLLSYQKYSMEENGGLVDYEAGLYDDLLLYPVNLLAAKNDGRQRGLFLKQQFLFTSDWDIHHEWRRWKQSKMYSDDYPASGFYSHLFLDSLQTFDSTFTQLSEHRVGFAYQNLSVDYLIEKHHYFDVATDSINYYHGIGLNYENGFFSLSTALLTATQYSTDLNFTYKGNLDWEFALSADQKKNSVYFNQFSSNHFNWNNDFDLEQKQNSFLSISTNSLSLKSEISRLNNYIYWNTSATPAQYGIAIYHLKNTVDWRWAWKKLHGHHQLINQNATNTYLLRFPDWKLCSELYLESPMFENAMIAKLGVQADFFTEYKAMAYMPALGQLYLQNDVFIGNYPFLTVFIEAQVQTATIKVQARNMSGVFLEGSHYILPDYPYSPMAVEFGISWLLP